MKTTRTICVAKLCKQPDYHKQSTSLLPQYLTTPCQINILHVTLLCGILLSSSILIEASIHAAKWILAVGCFRSNDCEPNAVHGHCDPHFPVGLCADAEAGTTSGDQEPSARVAALHATVADLEAVLGDPSTSVARAADRNARVGDPNARLGEPTTSGTGVSGAITRLLGAVAGSWGPSRQTGKL